MPSVRRLILIDLLGCSDVSLAGGSHPDALPTSVYFSYATFATTGLSCTARRYTLLANGAAASQAVPDTLRERTESVVDSNAFRNVKVSLP